MVLALDFSYRLPRWLSKLKRPPAMQATQEMQVQSLGRGNPLEEEMATHSRGAWQTTAHRVAKNRT